MNNWVFIDDFVFITILLGLIGIVVSGVYGGSLIGIRSVAKFIMGYIVTATILVLSTISWYFGIAEAIRSSNPQSLFLTEWWLFTPLPLLVLGLCYLVTFTLIDKQSSQPTLKNPPPARPNQLPYLGEPPKPPPQPSAPKPSPPVVPRIETGIKIKTRVSR